MRKDAFGLIYTGEHDFRLKDLTLSRAVAAVPLWGRYRIIDFMLSCLVNTGVNNVGIITQKNYHSLMDHIGSGKEWDLSRKREGLFLLPPFVTRDNTGVYRGMVDALKGVMGYIRRSSQTYAILMASHSVFKCTFDGAIERHIKTGADITAFTCRPGRDELEEMWDPAFVAINESGRVTDIEVAPPRPRYPDAMMDVWIIEKGLLEYLVEEAAARAVTHFTQGVLMPKLNELKIFAYRHEGYVARVDSVLSYFKASLAMLDEGLQREMFFDHGPIYTKVKDEVPARYGETGGAACSLVADGCIIEGSVERSILFRNVRIGKGARIRNSVIMQGAEIMEGARLENVILDKGVLIKRERNLIGQENYPVVIAKNVII